jgi:hypothetical protein
VLYAQQLESQTYVDFEQNEDSADSADSADVCKKLVASLLVRACCDPIDSPEQRGES